MADKTTRNLEAWCSGEGIDFVDEAAQAAYNGGPAESPTSFN